MDLQAQACPREQEIITLTRFMMHKHYCENDVEAVIAQMTDDIVWLGAGENEFAIGDDVISIFRQFGGLVPKCNLSDDEYHVVQIGRESYLCSGRVWIATDPSTKISLKVHQRVTLVFRLIEGRLRCCHIHISNPYEDMCGDMGFPIKMARHTYEYLQEQVRAQKKQIAAQTALLQRMSFEDTLTGCYNRNKFNLMMDAEPCKQGGRLGIAYFDLNGLKAVNDHLGHSAGDELLRRTAQEIQQVFPKKVYRIGGDEFVVIDDELEEEAFRSAVQTAQAGLKAHHISCSAGMSWRHQGCSIKEQFDEADQMMYQQKRSFHSIRENDRRHE